jgi:hypothetical protein
MDYRIPNIPTEYQGIQFDSQHEVRWATIFDNLDWNWIRPHQTIAGIWRPDFELSLCDIYGQDIRVLVEVKPGREHFPDALDKAERALGFESIPNVLFLFNPDKKGEQWWDTLRSDSDDDDGWANDLIESLEDEVVQSWEETRQSLRGDW